MTIISKCTRILLAFLAVICFVTIACFAFSSDVAFAESTEDTAISVADSGEDVPEDAVVSLTNGETVTYYTSFSNALGDALGGATLTFLQDTEMGGFSGTEEMSKGFTLELNGKTVTYTGGGIRTANLTIQDSVGGGTIDIGSNRLYFYVSGNFNFKSGRIIGDKYLLNTWGSFTTMNISGGRIETNIITSDNSAIIMTDGYVESLFDASNKSKISGGIVNEFVAYGIAKKLSGGTFMSIRFQDVGVDFKGLLCDGYAYTAADGTGLIKPSDMTTSTAVLVVECPHEAFTVDKQGQHVCDYCGYICTHEKYDKDECALCRQACAHEGVDENNRVCSECGGTMNIAVSDGTTTRYYVDFAYAAKQLADGDRMTLLSDIKLDYRDDNSIDKNITLDLNGKTLKGIYISIKASVTIIDSKDGGKVCFATSNNANVIYDCGPNTVAMIQYNIGKITFYNGKIDLINFANGHTFDEIVPTGYVVKYFDGTEIRKITKDAVNDCTIAANSGQYVLIEKCDHSAINSDLTCNYCGMDLGSILAGANADLKKAQSDLQSAIDEKADTQTINDLVAKLNEAITNAEAASKAYADAKDSEVKTELNDNISSAKNNAIKAATDALDAAKKELGDLIDQKVSSQELLDAIDTLNDAIANAETASNAYADSKDNVVKELMTAAIASAKTGAIQSANEALDAAKTQLSAKIDSKASANEVNAAIAELNNAIATAETVSKAYADDKNAELKDELESKIEDSKAEVAAAINALSERLGAVESKIEENAQKTDTLQTVLIVFIVLFALANVATVVVFSLHKRR